MIAIIDADTIAVKAAAVCQETNYKTQEVISLEPIQNAYHLVKQQMLKILEVTRAKDYKAFVSKDNDIDSFRLKLYDKYKENRKGKVKPFYTGKMKGYLINTWKATETRILEADDVCVIEQYKYGEFSDDIDTINQHMDGLILTGDFRSVLCHIDKDLNQCPGLHFNYNKNIFYYITELQGIKNLYFQILTGDVADNVPRIKKRWIQTKAEERIKVAKSKKEVYDIIVDETIIALKCTEETALTELRWRANLLYLKTNYTDEFKFVGE